MDREANENESGYPLVAVIHMTTVFALILGCVTPGRVQDAFLADPSEFIPGLIAAFLAGLVVGLFVGLAEVRRFRGAMIGAAAGAATALLLVFVVGSGGYGRLLAISPVLVAWPMVLRARHV